MRAGWRLVIVFVGVAVAASGAAAQSADQTLTRAINAYQNLDFDLAAVLFRRVLAASGSDSVPSTSRTRALAYLGASEWFRGRRDSAAAVFRRLVLLDPRYQPDEMVFPPDVTSAFGQIRRDTKVVAARTPPEATVQVGEGRYSAWLFASSPHDVTVTLVRDDGTPARSLYRGPIGDSLEVLWDGLDSAGILIRAGTYLMRIASRGPDGRTLRIAQARLEVSVVHRDTLAVSAAPPDSLLLPERGKGQHPVGALLAGILGGVTVAALPAALASGAHASDARFAVAGAVSLTGLIGFFRQGEHPLPRNIASNRALRDAWQRRTQVTIEENARRRRDVKLVVRTSRTVIIDGEGF